MNIETLELNAVAEVTKADETVELLTLSMMTWIRRGRSHVGVTVKAHSSVRNQPLRDIPNSRVSH